MEALRGKRLVVFCVGASPYDKKAVEQIHQHNLKGKLKKYHIAFIVEAAFGRKYNVF